MVQAGIDDVLPAAAEPDAFAEEGIDGAGGVTFPGEDFRQERRPAAKLGLAAMRHHAMCDRMLSGEDGGMRWLGGDGRGEAMLEERSLAGELIDVRTGGKRIAVASQVVGAQGIGADENDIRFFLHGS